MALYIGVHLNDKFLLLGLYAGDFRELLYDHEKREAINVKPEICYIFVRLFQIMVSWIRVLLNTNINRLMGV